MSTTEKLNNTTIFLHWIIAITIISLMSIGWYMSKFKAYGLYDIHKSVGILMFLIIVYRVAWRLKHGFPEPIGEAQTYELILAKVVHWILLAGSLLFPLSGMLMSGAGGHGLYVFGFELLAENPHPETGRAMALNKTLAEWGSQMHGLLFWVLLIALLLHVGGALKHHFIYKDRTLKRMLGK